MSSGGPSRTIRTAQVSAMPTPTSLRRLGSIRLARRSCRTLALNGRTSDQAETPKLKGTFRRDGKAAGMRAVDPLLNSPPPSPLQLAPLVRSMRSRKVAAPAVAPAPPMRPVRDRHEMRADVHMDMVHAGVRHGAAAVVGNQPFDNRGFAATGIEVHRVAAGVLRGAPGLRR